jgi:hypothetical protein
MANKKAGRPTVITPEVVSILISSFHSGMTVREACWQSGISHETYYSRIREDDEFADTMARAQILCNQKARMVVIDAINNGDVSTSKWWLERKASEEFGRNTKLDSTEKTNPKVNPFSKMSDEEMEKLASELYFIINT